MTGNQEIFQLALTRLNAYIEKEGLNHSPERVQILKHICQHKHLFATKEVVEWVKSQNIARATVYNAIQVFVGADILRGVVTVGGHNKQYELFSETGHHIRLVCERCGRVDTLDDLMLQDFVRNKKYKNFVMEHFTLLIYGHCKYCRRKTAPNAKSNISKNNKKS